MSFKTLKEHLHFSGRTLFAEHESSATKTTMKFSCFLPAPIEQIDSAIIWLSGLTCNEENFITKAGAQRALSNTKTMIICPDTSPRGLNLEGEDESYDFGTGAGFYLNATKAPYESNYNMYDYIQKDLVSLLNESFGVDKISISGHSMGGHGALILGLRNPELFQSVSAFSPIVNPIKAPWGQKAFNGYLGDDSNSWKNYDATELITSGNTHPRPILIEQGLGDEFLEKELLTQNIMSAAKDSDQEIMLNEREGFDHSYYFISTFIEDHIKYHLSYLQA